MTLGPLQAGDAGPAARSYVRRVLLDAIPTDPNDAVTRATLAARSDITPERVREHLRPLVNRGLVIAIGDNGRPRYHRRQPEDRMPKKTTMRDRVAEVLPRGATNAKTAKDLAAGLDVPTGNIAAVLVHLRDAGVAHRDGRGGAADPFRYYAPGPHPDPDGEPVPETAESEAVASTLTADLPEADTLASPENGENGPDRAWRCPVCKGRFPHPGGGCPTPFAIAADIIDPPPAPGDMTEAEAFDRVARSLEARAIEARRDAEILTAAAKLAVRIRDELAPPAVRGATA